MNGSVTVLDNLQLIICDFGGLLRDSSAALDRGYREGFECEGFVYPYSVEDTWRLRGVGKYDISTECLSVLLALVIRGETRRLPEIIKESSAESVLDQLIKQTDSVEFRRTVERIRQQYKKFADSPEAGEVTVVYPFAERAVESISDKGYKVAMLTNASNEVVRRDLPFADKFDLILSENDVPAKKPSSIGLLMIMSQLGCLPSQTAFVTDAPIDIMAGKEAGIRCIGVLGGVSTEMHLGLYSPDLIVNDLEELSQLLPNSGSSGIHGHPGVS